MAKVNKTGVFLDDKTNSWGYRIKMLDGTGKKVDTRITGFKNMTEASTARQDKVAELKQRKPETYEKDFTKTFQQVYEHYKEHRALEKKPATIRKQDSLWKHHIQPLFGHRKLAEVSKGEIQDYLVQLYNRGDKFNNYGTGYAYEYVEGFLKLFWLIYGYAYDHHWLDSERYTVDFLNKGTKLRMPKKNEIDEDLKIEIYTQEEISKIGEVLKDSNIYISFLIGYFCGLRVSECMGLMWKDFSEKDHTLEIRKQMLYDSTEHMFYLTTPKTAAGKRTVYVPDALYNYLIEYKKQQKIDRQCRGYKATEIVLDEFTGKEIQGGEFIQRKKNGELITINSIKYWSKRVKELTGIHFHYHALRHTNASMLAANNVPKKTLAEHLGHANTNIAEQYYISTNEVAQSKLQNALNSFIA